MAADGHPLPQIKTMGGETLDARIQLQAFATLFARELTEPVQQLLA